MGFGETLYTIIFHYSQFYFVTIAVTFGSGVLGLPTTLADSGFQPFLITILLSYIVQVITILFFTEVMQKAYYRNVDKLQENNKAYVPIHVESYELQTYGSKSDVVEKSTNDSDTIQQCLPNLHSMGELFLPYFLPYLFTLTLIALFIVFLISYILAGSQTFATLFNVSFYTIVPVFCWTFTVVIIFFHSLISPIISILTLFKIILFIVTVLLTFTVAVQNPISVVNDFRDTLDSFLMTLVALSGFVNAMPLMFRQVKQTRNGIIGFNIAIFLGLTTCLILDILWCWSVLAIVPQQSICLPNNDTALIQMSSNLVGETPGQCVESPSLQNSLDNGQIATIPLSKILGNDQNRFSWSISILIQVFVAISVSVSFISIGSVLYHTLNGAVDSFWSSSTESEISFGTIFKFINVQLIREWFVGLIVFTIIFAIAISNPKSFNVFVQEFGSLFMSITVGIFYAIMIYKSTFSSEFSSYVIPFQIPRWFFPCQYIIPIYYICGITYNVYSAIVFFINN